MSRISVEWIDEHRREVVTGSAIIIIFFLAVFWWYIFSTASTGPLQMSAISGVVFIDDDVDGVFSPDDEFGFPAVAIQLYDSSGLLTSEVTDDEGTFIFSGLDPGEYTVREILPNDWEATSERELDVNVAQGETLFLSFGLAEIEEGPIPVVLTYGTLSGTVYDDDNNNGEFDELEIGVENVQVKLSNALGEIAEMLTDSEGEYLFENIRTGEYRLNEVVPQGWYNTTDSNVKGVVVSEQVTVTDFGIGKVTEGDGDDDEETGPSSTITVQVFRDSNENKVHDSSERGILGVAISLMEGEELVDKQSTNSKGRVLFEVTNAGTYTVMEKDLSSYTSTTPNEVEVEVVLETDYKVFFGDYKEPDPKPKPDPSESTIVGTVFHDADGDGSVDQGEDGISGVTVSLEKSGSSYRSSVTDSNGQVSFSDLLDGSYQLIETDPDGYFSTTPNTLSFSVTGKTYTGIFGDAEYASLYGYAFDDADGDGIFNEGEVGLYGVTVSLYDDEGFLTSVTTGEDGLYSFTELMPGIYEVSSDPVDGYFRTTPGSVQVELEPGDDKRVDFGYAPDPSPFGSVYGTVYNDKDGSKDRSLGELGLEGVDVTLILVDDGSQLTTTDEFGVYTFKISFEGSYNIQEEDLTSEGWYSTTPDDIPVSAVFSSDNDSPHDFGDTLGATVSGMVYEDVNEDGVKDAEEEGVPDVTVKLLQKEVEVASTTTEEDGTYSFQVLASGKYTVEETDLEDWFSTTDNDVPVSIGELTGQVETADFGDYHGPWGTIWGIVWDDSDVDGLIGEEDGIEGILVSLFDDNGLFATTTTDTDGEYWFEDLVPGIYDVETEEIDNYFRTTPGLVKPNVESGDTKQVNFGFAYIENDFGSLYGTVYNDKDGDTERDFTELGLEGVTVNLFPAESDEPSQTTTTNEYGYYTFKITGSSTNLIKETNPTGYYSTTPNRIIQSCSIMSENDSPHDYGDNLGAIVSGMVYDDFDRDEVKDGDEVGVEGVTVELYLDDNPDNSTVTDENGEYSFLILKPGDYELRETDLTGWESSTDNELPFTVSELTGQEIEDKDFGDYELGKGRIKGIVFDDEDGDGIIDAEEDGIPGVTVSLYDEDDEFVESEETDENGEYMFESLIPSKYVLRETNPDDYQSTTSDKVVVDLEEEEEETVNFGDRDSGDFGGIYGTVWNDENGDGIRDVELGLKDVRVNLYTLEEGENTFIKFTITNEHGRYNFTNLGTDDYLVEEINLPGWTSTTDDEVEKSVSSPNTYEVDYGDIFPNPIISVFKYVIDPQTFSGQTLKSVTVASGTEVDYKIVIGNSGNVPLTNIILVDDVLGDLTPSPTTLNPGNAMLFEVSHTVTEDTTNTATVTATYITPDPDDDDVEVSDEDSATVTIGVMEITVTKEVSKDGSTWIEDHVDVYIGDTVYYRFTVENTGTLTLTGITLEDVMDSDPAQSITLIDTSLPPDESTTNAGPVKVTAVDGQHTNTATAEGWYLTFDTSDTDTTSYTATPEPARIHGTVFYDKNKDEDQDSGEYGIKETTIKLWQDTTLVSSTKTDSLGEYEFNDLTPGSYKVEEIDRIQPADGGISTTPNEVDVPLLSGDDEEVNFGDYAEKGDVDGYVFFDRDGDGNWDGVERDISGVTVQLKQGATVVDSDETDSDGYYKFTVAPGTYDVFVVKPSYYDDVTTENPVEVIVTDYSYDRVDFGLTHDAGIDIHVFHDINRDGDKDGGDYGIDGVEIKVYNDDGYLKSYYTKSNGWVYISDLTPGTYTFIEVDPDGYYSTTSNRYTRTLPAGQYYYDLYYGDAQNTDLTIKKQVIDGNDVARDSGAHVKVGEKFKFKFTITNHGSEDITDLDYHDWSINPSSLPSTVSPGTTIIDVDSAFAAYEGYDWESIHVWKPGYGYIAYDSCDWFGEDAEIWVYVEVQDADSTYMQSGAQVRAGGDAKYHFVVENRGNVDLTNVVIVDSVLGSVFSPFSLSEGGRRDDLYDTQPAVLDSGGRSVTAYGDTPIQDDVFASADASYTGKKVDLEITKEVSTDGSIWDPNHVDVAIGDTVYYRITVENTGDETLTGITLSDPDLWTTDKTYSSLAPGATIVEPEQVTAAEGTMSNTAEVSAWWYSIELTGDDSASYFGADIDYTFTKEVRGHEGWEPIQAYQLTGEPVSYQFIIINDGNVDLTDLEINDPMLETLDPPQNPIDVGTVAAGSQETIGSYTISAVEGTHTNTATLTGNHLLGTVNEVDTATYTAGELGITVTKQVSLVNDYTDDTVWKEYVTLPVDEYVYYRFIIENTGDFTLEHIGLNDDLVHGPIELEATTLVPGATTTNKYTVKDQAAPGEYKNTVRATGLWNNIPVDSEEDTATYFGVDRDIVFWKEIKGPIGDWQYNDPVTVKTGETVSYRFIIENNGNVDLTGVEIDDPILDTPDISGIPILVGTVEYEDIYISPTFTVTATTGTHENEATMTGSDSQGPVELKDTATYKAGDPKISVTKEVSTDGVDWDDVNVDVFVGDTVYYKFTVENTGDVPLSYVTVYDTHFGTIVGPPTLEPGVSNAKEYLRQVDDALTGKWENTVTANGEWEGIFAPEAEDEAYYFGVDLDYTFRKEVMGYDGSWQDDQAYQLTNDPVSYQFIIINGGNVDLTDLEISDPMLDILDPQQDPIDVGTVAAGGLPVTLGPYTITAVEGSHTNTATLTGNHLLGTVNEEDTATYDAGTPEISVTKEVSTGPDGPWSPNLYVFVGETVYYKFTVENTGDVTLENVVVYDNHFGTIKSSLTLEPGVLNAKEYFEKVDNALPDQQDNKVTANGEWEGIFAPEAEDEAYYIGEDPKLTILKEVKGYDEDWKDVKTYARTGDDVYFKITIENTGNVELTNLELTDPNLQDPITITSLPTTPPDHIYTKEYSIKAVEGEHTNKAEVTTDYKTKTVSGDDSATYEAGTLGITVDKQVSLVGDYNDDNVWSDNIDAYVGDTVYYRFVVTNTGLVPLSSITLTDPDMIPSTIVLQTDSLASGAVTYNANPLSTTAIADKQENTATVSGEWQGIPATDAEDTAYYFGMNPQITVNKKVWGPITEAWYDTTVVIPLDQHPKFEYTITNTGNVDLTDIDVIDDVLGTISMATELEAGDLDTETVTDDDLAVSGLHTNEVTVTAMHDQKQVGPVTDQVTYYGGTPGMEIIKLIKGPDGLWHDVPVILDENDDVYYKYTVTNTGSTPITGLKVIDDLLGPITMSKVDLDIGESAEGTAQSTAVGGTITNTATATATSYDVPLEDEETATYAVHTEAYIAGIVFEDLNLNGVFDIGEPGKSGVIIDLSGPSSGSDTSGPDGTYSFTVTQAGTYTVTAPDISGWQIQTDDEVDVTVNANELDGREFTVNFGYAEETCEYRDYYLAYEDACDNTFEDFGMIFEVNEVYLYGYLQEIQMEFTSRIYDSSYDHLIHIKRNINGASTVKIERTVSVYGDETPAGTYNLNGDVDVILYDTEKYSNPSKKMNEIVLVTITLDDPQSNPKTEDTPPRQFQNEATEPFYDLDSFWANYDPYEESNHPFYSDWHIYEKIYTTMFGSPGIYVPRILAIPETDWIPPYTGTCIVQPYGSFDDYYRYGILEDWWHSSMVTNNAVEYGGLSWGPYSLP